MGQKEVVALAEMGEERADEGGYWLYIEEEEAVEGWERAAAGLLVLLRGHDGGLCSWSWRVWLSNTCSLRSCTLNCENRPLKFQFSVCCDGL